jgi:hypothetical protein
LCIAKEEKSKDFSSFWRFCCTNSSDLPRLHKTCSRRSCKPFVNICAWYGKTAKAVAREVGVDAVYAEVLPEDKAAFVRSEKAAGHTVASGMFKPAAHIIRSW